MRQVASQGVGLYPCSEKIIESLLELLREERNTLLRETGRKILIRFLRKTDDQLIPQGLRARVEAAVHQPTELVPADAEEMLDSIGKGHEGIRNTYRRALVGSGARWTSILGSIYLLGGSGDEVSRQDIIAVAKESEEPEVRQAYEEVRALGTFDPVLPELTERT